MASGDVILMLHADCWLADGALDQLRQLAGRESRVFGCFRQRIEDERYRFRWLEWGNQLRATWQRLPYGDQAVFVDRASYDEVGGIDAVPLMEDVLFANKMKRVCPPAMLQGPVCLHPRHWNRRGVLQQTLRNWAIMAAFRLGVSPKQLARWYS